MEELVETRVELEFEKETKVVGQSRRRRRSGPSLNNSNNKTSSCSSSGDNSNVTRIVSRSLTLSSLTTTNSPQQTGLEPLPKNKNPPAQNSSDGGWASLRLPFRVYECPFNLVSRTWFWVDCWWQCLLGWIHVIFVTEPKPKPTPSSKCSNSASSARGVGLIRALQGGGGGGGGGGEDGSEAGVVGSAQNCDCDCENLLRSSISISSVVMNGNGGEMSSEGPSSPLRMRMWSESKSKSYGDCSVGAVSQGTIMSSEMSIQKLALGGGGDSDSGSGSAGGGAGGWLSSSSDARNKSEWCYNGRENPLLNPNQKSETSTTRSGGRSLLGRARSSSSGGGRSGTMAGAVRRIGNAGMVGTVDGLGLGLSGCEAPNVRGNDSVLHVDGGSCGSRRGGGGGGVGPTSTTESGVVVEEETEQEQQERVWKPVGVGTQLLSLSVVVAGLIGTVAVPLNIALFFTIISSSCALTLVWIFFIIRSYLHHHREQEEQQEQEQPPHQHTHTHNHQPNCVSSEHVPRKERPQSVIKDGERDSSSLCLNSSHLSASSSPQNQNQTQTQNLNSSGQLLLLGSSKSPNSPTNLNLANNSSSIEIGTPTLTPTHHRRNYSAQFLELIQRRAESQVEIYLFSLWWLLSVCDWLCSVIVIFLNSQSPSYLNLSLESFSWVVHVAAAAFSPSVIIAFWSRSLSPLWTWRRSSSSSSNNSSQFNNHSHHRAASHEKVVFPPQLCIFFYVLFVRRLGAFFFPTYFPYTLLIQVTSVVGLIIGKVAAHYIFTTLTSYQILSSDQSEDSSSAAAVTSQDTLRCCLNGTDGRSPSASSSSPFPASNPNEEQSQNLIKTYQDKDDINSDYSDNPANLRRRSSGNLNGLTNNTGSSLSSSCAPGVRLTKEGPNNSQSSSHQQTKRSSSIPSYSVVGQAEGGSSSATGGDSSNNNNNNNFNCSRRLSNCGAPSDNQFQFFESETRVNRTSSLPSNSTQLLTTSLQQSVISVSAGCGSSGGGVLVREKSKSKSRSNSCEKSSTTREDEEGRKSELEEKSLELAQSASSSSGDIHKSSSSSIGQFHHQDSARRRAVNTFSLSRCQSAVHIVSGQHREVEKMRRTSLPAALPAQRHTIHHGSGGVDTALLLEAHGLVTDMLMDHAALPAHIVAGLKALATLLTPPPLPMMHYQNTRPRPAPLMLTNDPEYTSDIDEIPYTGEKIWCMPGMPKRNSGGPCKKGGVSANLLRRMSTSTWTTTTSATGMPTLEPQPHARRRRSASFRSAIDGTPGSSPTQPYGMILETAAMRVQSTIAASSSSAHVPNAALQASHKSRSFSANALYASSDSRRRFSQQELSTSQRKTVCSLHPLSPSDLTHLSALAAHSSTAAASSSVLSSPAGTPISSPLPSPLPSRDPSPSVNPNSIYRRSSSPPKLLFHPRSSSFAVPTEDGTPGKTYLENPDDDNCSTASTLGDGPGPPLTSYNFPDNLGSSHRLSPVTFTLQEPTDDQPLSSSNDDDSGEVVISSDGIRFDLMSIASDPVLCRLNEWDYPIFDLEINSNTQILSHMCYKVFLDVGLFETFKIPIKEFINYFHALEMGYRDKPYHNRMHAADVLHGVYYLTSQPIPGFEILLSDPETPCAADATGHRAWFNVEESSYGIMGANFPALELMAMYTAAAMHDYDHPGRTNAFLVTTHAPQAILYNDRSVLENHHAAAAWSLLLSSDECNFLKYLDKAEFKRFRYLVIEAILATDLKRHFEILAEFNAKANEDDSPGIDWNLEADRLLVMEMCIKLADINGPCKYHDIHVRWTYRIAEEFYEQGDEEEELGLPISPYMDRKHPQLAKLQESFINHLVAPLCKACAEAGILPGFWEEEEETADEVSSCQETDNENDSSYSDDNSESKKSKRKIICLQTQHLQDNHRYWMNVIKEETRKKEEGVKTESVAISTEDPMETIEEENNTPHSLNRSFSFEKEDSKL